ncbi:MAG: SWIM zinc finger family protein [Synechococcales bacterium]|nr:SWIM zinc finger family protein [Synechococcales bacterium]
MDLQSLTENDVYELADNSQVYERGEDYYDSEAIATLSLAPHQITAKVQGGHGLYRVTVSDRSGRLETHCTCPYDGNVCKHIVAVLLQYLRDEDPLPAPETEGDPDALAQTLTALSHEELLKVVLDLARDKPNVRRSLLAVVPISTQTLRQQPQNSKVVKVLKRQISDFFNNLQFQSEHDYDYDYEYDEEEVYSELETTFTEAETLHPADQIEVFWHAVTCGNDLFDEYPIGTVQIEDAILHYGKAVQRLRLPHPQKQLHFNSLLSILDWGMTEYGNIFDAVKDSLDTICTEPKDYYYLIEILSGSDDKDVVDWIIGWYRDMGDDGRYLQMRQAHLHHEEHYLELAQYWQEQGDDDAYLSTLEAGAAFLVESQERAAATGSFYSRYIQLEARPLLTTLVEHYQQAGDDESVNRILMIQAQVEGVTLEQYQEIRPLATQLEVWPSQRSQLLRWASLNSTELARIYLYEQDWQAALTLAASKPIECESLRVLVAEGVKQACPQEAINLYEEMIQANINRKSRKYYHQAAIYAKAMKDIYLDILQEPEKWRAYIRQLRDSYSRYRALQDEFARV